MNNSVLQLQYNPACQPIYLDAGAVVRQLQPEASVFLYSERCLQRRARHFLEGFPGEVGYAVKANPESMLIDGLVAAGVRHFDVASAAEVRAVASRHPGATLHFNNPIKTPAAIAEAYHDCGVRSFVVDEALEIDKIDAATDSDPQVLYSVRFKLAHEGAAYDFGSKFGATPEVAVQLLRRVAALGVRPALTFHPGSQCTSPEVYRRYIETAAGICAAAEVEIEQLNVGGGFPEYYRNTAAPALETYFSVIDQAMSTYFPARPRLLCEPGRAMAGSAVSLLARVIHVREDAGDVFLSDGIYGGLQEQSLIDLQLPLRVWRDGELLAGGSSKRGVFGPTCDPVDRLPGSVPLPVTISPGDYVEFGLLGAYGSATATNFNGFLPAEYLRVATGFEALAAGRG